MVKVKELDSYKAYGRVLSISNGVVEAYVTLDVGPRIIRYGFVGSQNIMNDDRSLFTPSAKDNYEDYFGKGKKWDNMGGHRIWASPESYPETYYPDSEPIKYEITENGAVFTPAPEKENGMSKQLEIKMDADDTNMQVIMRIKNISDKPLKYSIWGLSVSAKNGTVIIPMNTNDTGLLSNRIISVWPYTDMSDERLYWGKKYVTLKQDVNAKCPIKLGFDLNGGKVFYVLGDEVFCKRYEVNHPNGTYPDGGCSFETYTNADFIELESLGELKTFASGETASHSEFWSLLKKPCEVDLKNDASIDNFISKL